MAKVELEEVFSEVRLQDPGYLKSYCVRCDLVPRGAPNPKTYIVW
jgi:hypothetical protein